MSGGYNNHTLAIITSDLHELWVLYPWPYIMVFFVSFLAISDNFSNVIVRFDACANVLSLIAAKLDISKKNNNYTNKFSIKQHIINMSETLKLTH